MSKWCGDENCLQCADKEPDPYVHLPRADYEALREQNRVLREALEEFCKATEYVASRMAYQCGLGAGEWEAFIAQTNYYKQYKQGKAALTATSQPEPCTNHFSDGSKIFPSRDCCKPATSQEGQHGAAS